MKHEEIPQGNLRCPPLGRSEVAIKGNKETPGELLGVICLSYSPLVLLKQRPRKNHYWICDGGRLLSQVQVGCRVTR